MDFGEAKFMLSRKLTQQLLVIQSERQIGYQYKFQKKNDFQLANCSSCKRLGKSRIVTVKDGRIVGKKHPEDDHHVDCNPVADEDIDVLDMDRYGSVF